MIEYIDDVPYKWCPRCEDYIPVEDFHKNKGSSDGLRSYCKPCYREYAREHYDKNREHINQWYHEWYDKNRDYYNQQKREYRENNRERINQYRREYAREYYANNPDQHHKKLFALRLNAAVHAGKIIKPDNCSICGSTERIEGHHPDYEPGHELIVVWVCAQCHANITRELRNETI